MLTSYLGEIYNKPHSDADENAYADTIHLHRTVNKALKAQKNYSSRHSNTTQGHECSKKQS